MSSWPCAAYVDRPHRRLGALRCPLALPGFEDVWCASCRRAAHRVCERGLRVDDWPLYWDNLVANKLVPDPSSAQPAVVAKLREIATRLLSRAEVRPSSRDTTRSNVTLSSVVEDYWREWLAKHDADPPQEDGVPMELCTLWARLAGIPENERGATVMRLIRTLRTTHQVDVTQLIDASPALAELLVEVWRRHKQQLSDSGAEASIWTSLKAALNAQIDKLGSPEPSRRRLRPKAASGTPPLTPTFSALHTIAALAAGRVAKGSPRRSIDMDDTVHSNLPQLKRTKRNATTAPRGIADLLADYGATRLAELVREASDHTKLLSVAEEAELVRLSGELLAAAAAAEASVAPTNDSDSDAEEEGDDESTATTTPHSHHARRRRLQSEALGVVELARRLRVFLADTAHLTTVDALEGVASLLR